MRCYRLLLWEVITGKMGGIPSLSFQGTLRDFLEPVGLGACQVFSKVGGNGHSNQQHY